MKTMTTLTVLIVSLLVVGCGQEDTFLGTWINDTAEEDVVIEIVSMDPCEVHFETEDGNILRSYQTDEGPGDDGTFDWVIMENSGGGIFGLMFPRNTYSYIEVAFFDDNGIAFKDSFHRPE